MFGEFLLDLYHPENNDNLCELWEGKRPLSIPETIELEPRKLMNSHTPKQGAIHVYL